MFDSLMAFRKLMAATFLMFAAAIPATIAGAQQIVVIVNGEPITALDVDQRSKLSQLSTHKVPPRQEVLDELINEKLKLREAKKFGLDVSASEVDTAYASMAGRMRFTADQLTQQLARSGVNVSTLKAPDQGRHRLVADRARAIRSRACRSARKISSPPWTRTPTTTVGYDYTMRPILFLVPAGSAETFIEGRKREAEALRGRFQGCEEGITFARALKDVAVREQVIRSSADIPAELRKVLEGIEVGRLTPPEVTKFGVEMFAICAKKESTADNSPGKRQAKESLMAQRYEQRSKQYLQELRRGAMLEYK